MTPCAAFIFLSVVQAVAQALVVPLRLHERQPRNARSFLSLESSTEARVAYLREKHNNTHAIEYYGEVIVGNQTFSVLFDTGSDQLAIPSASCVADACAGHRLYDATDSDTAGPDNGDDPSFARELAFGTGTAMGFVREETICLGGACARAEFVETLQESDDPFLHAKFDGVMGLSLQLRSNASNKTSVLQALVNAKAIPRASFSVFMAKDLHSDTSEIAFGEPDASKAASANVWAPLSDPGYWQFSLGGIAVGSKDLNICNLEKPLAVNTSVSMFFGKMCCRTVDEFDHEERCQFHENYTGWRSHTASPGVVLATFEDGRVAAQMSDGCVQKVPMKWLTLPDGCRGDGTIQTILDTGSSLMMAPAPIVEKISAAIGVRENCTEQPGDDFPTLTFVLPGGQNLSLGPADYMDTVVDGKDSFCWLHLMPMPEVGKGALFVLGMPFLRAYYTTFDAEQKRIGFALPHQTPAAAPKKADAQILASASALRGSEIGRVAMHGRRPE